MTRSIPARLGHVGIEVSDLAKARRFFGLILSRLGFRSVRTTSPRWIGFRRGGTTLWLTQSWPPRVHRRAARVPKTDEEDPISDHLAFQVRSAREVVALQRMLERQGLHPIYPVEWQASQGGLWYVSTAWTDADGVVLEVYATPRRSSRARRSPKPVGAS
ncbi:MAG: VOC family protein [Thermoplasmata archaeon]|nr:VOC family protein [Thermoplasmata archaeon]MCI4337882.1 VOC family protein [Thermoplasmata archaeon]MCI4341333.1 VOC family protein [Thermoplasmata archaeon]